MNFKVYVEARDKEVLKNLGLNRSNFQIMKFPHKKYDVKKADKVANNYITQWTKKEAENTEKAINRQLINYYMYGKGNFDKELLKLWKAKLENSPIDINWHMPDPRSLFIACDWLEEQGTDATKLRNYANTVWNLVKIQQNKLTINPKKTAHKLDYEEIDDNIDLPF